MKTRVTVLITILAALLLVAAACTPGTSPTTEATERAEAPERAGATEEAEPTEEEAATEEPEPTEEAQPTEEEAGAGDGGPLEEMLPDQVGPISMEYQAMSGEEFVGEEGVTAELQGFLDRVGADLSDISAVFGIGVNEEDPAEGFVTIFAIRVAGADPGQLQEEFRASIEEENPDADVEEGNVGGKDVLIVGDPEDISGTSYVYARGDVFFMVGAQSERLAAEALSQLP
jgi:hypothetical protein